MATSINFESQRIVERSVNLACQGNTEDAMRVLEPLGLSNEQNQKIATLFQKMECNTDAPSLREYVIQILLGNADSTSSQKGKAKTPSNSSPLTLGPCSLLGLPQEVLNNIFHHLSIKDICECSQVCTSLDEARQNQILWQELYQRDFPPDYPQKNFSSGYFQAYKNANTVRLNFINGIYSLKPLYLYETVLTHIIFDGKLYLGCTDNTIKVWDLEAKKYLKNTFKVSEMPISALAVYDRLLYSGCLSGIIKIWDLTTGECLETLHEHRDGVSSFAFFGGRFFSGSFDKTIKVWDLVTRKCLNTFKEHEDEVMSLAVFDGKLFSGSLDQTIVVWDLEREEHLQTLEGHQEGVNCVYVYKEKLYSGSNDYTIKVWDLGTGECLQTLKGHQREINSVVVFDGKLCSGSNDQTVKIWDLGTRECLNTLKGNLGVISLSIVDGMLFSSLNDHTIEIWDFTAEDDVIFSEIAELFNKNTENAIKEAMERFSKMPQKAKNKIFEELYLILSPFTNDYFGCGEHAFYGLHGLSSTPKQKAQAIKNYLIKSHGM